MVASKTDSFKISILETILQEQGRRADPGFIYDIEHAISAHMKQRAANKPRHTLPAEQNFFVKHILNPMQAIENLSQKDIDYGICDIWLRVVDIARNQFQTGLPNYHAKRPRLMYSHGRMIIV